MVRLGDDGLVWLQDHASLVDIDMQGSQDEDEAGEGGVGGDGLQPVIIDVEQHHLWLCCLQDQVTKLLNLQSCLQHQGGNVRAANIHLHMLIHNRLMQALQHVTDVQGHCYKCCMHPIYIQTSLR